MIKFSPMPALNRLKMYLEIDANFPSGLKWVKAYTNRVKPNTNAGSKKRYWCVSFDNKQYAVHRLVYFLAHKIDPGFKDIDHKDGDCLNNKIENLRLVTRQINNANRKSTKNSSSVYKGVSLNKKLNKWVVNITKDYKTIYLGLFENEIDAALAYNQKAKQLYGEYALLNNVYVNS
jgi:hypothetical protein